jgi:hypothetical protein
MTLNYQAPPDPPPTNHNAIYSSLLGALAFLMLMSAGTCYSVMQMPTMPANGRWVFQMTIFIEVSYAAVSVLVLLIRLIFPSHRGWPTFALNIVLLTCFPLGTALAIYGFLKVDKPPVRYLPPPLPPNL